MQVSSVSIILYFSIKNNFYYIQIHVEQFINLNSVLSNYLILIIYEILQYEAGKLKNKVMKSYNEINCVMLPNY